MILTTLSLASSFALATVESDFDSTLSLDPGTAYYVSPAAAGSEGSWYFKPGLSINMVDDIDLVGADLTGDGVLDTGTISWDDSTSFSIGFGMHLTDTIRAEVSYMEADNDANTDVILNGGPGVLLVPLTLEQEFISLQALIDFNPTGELNPYFGGGMTMADATLKSGDVNLSDSDDTTFHLTAGLTWHTESLDLTAEYRMFSADYTDGEVDNSTLFIGLIWHF